MKISFISTMGTYAWGGSEELWYEAALNAINKNHTILFSTYTHSPINIKINNLINLGATPVFRTKAGNSLQEKITQRILTPNKKQYSVIDKFNSDFICVSQGGTYDFLHDKSLLSLLEKYPKKYALICHGNQPDFVLNQSQIELTKKIIYNASFVGFVANWAQKLCERQILSKISNSIIFNNPVNLDFGRIPDLEIYENLNILKFAMVGSLTLAWKGHDILLEALCDDKWKNCDWELSIYGSGKDQEYISKLITYHGLSNKVKLLGQTNDINDVWRKNHLHLMPSRVETAPIALVESMLCGRVSVCTNVGGISEFIKDEVTGFLACCATSESFNGALVHAVESVHSWPTIGQSAQDKAANIVFSSNPDLLNEIEKTS